MVFGDQTSCFQNRNQKPSKDGGGFIGLWQILTNFLLWESWKQELYLGYLLRGQFIKPQTSDIEVNTILYFSLYLEMKQKMQNKAQDPIEINVNTGSR